MKSWGFNNSKIKVKEESYRMFNLCCRRADSIGRSEYLRSNGKISLVNIYKEINSDLGLPIPNHGFLMHWAKQGVLLLNTVLTVEYNKAFSHRGMGWETFTDHILQQLNTLDQPIVFLLWGKPAQQKAQFLNNPKHLVLKAAHPSPLSAYNGFFGCKHFSKTNDFLVQHGCTPIDWRV